MRNAAWWVAAGVCGVMLGACAGRGGTTPGTLPPDQQAREADGSAPKPPVASVVVPPVVAAENPTPGATTSITPAPDAGPAPGPTDGAAPETEPTWVEVFPGVRVCKALKSVEFGGTVPIDVHGKAPRVFLEVLVCSSDTREHEALVVTAARPSQVHAALLMLGLAPGAPGAWRFEHAELKSTPPSGPRVRVRLHYERDGAPVTEDASEWVVNLRGGARLSDRADEHSVFTGSQFRQMEGADVYAADPEGTLVGLTAFGTEAIAWSAMYHPDSAFEQPQWIADPARVPAMGTHVTVSITAHE